MKKALKKGTCKVFKSKFKSCSSKAHCDEKMKAESSNDSDLQMVDLSLGAHIEGSSSSGQAEFDRRLDDVKSWFSSMTVEKRVDVYRSLLETPKPNYEESIKEAAEVVKLANQKASVDFIKLLPSDAGLKILSYLDHRTLLTAATVCKEWAALANNDDLWKRLCRQHINKKCKVCGLGMPMATICVSSDETVQWKTVFYDRLQLEMSWRHGKAFQTIIPSPSPVTALIANNRMIVSGHEDGQARVYCIRTLQFHKAVPMHSESITCLAEDEKRIVSGSMDGTVKIWCMSTFKLVRTLQSTSRSVASVFMSTKWLVAGGVDGVITVWSLKTGSVFNLKAHTGAVTGLGIVAHGLCSVSEDGTVRTWHLEKQVPLDCITGHKDGITRMSGIKCVFATASRDKTIKVWETSKTGITELKHTSFGHESVVRCVKMDSLRIVSGSEDHSIKVFDKFDGNMLYSLAGHRAAVDCISSKDSYIISGDRSGTLIHWNFASCIPQCTKMY